MGRHRHLRPSQPVGFGLADGWDDIATFAQAKADWLGRRLDLTHGTPSGDTFRRVLAALSPEAFAQGFVRWVEAVAQKTTGEVIAIDGKTLRRSYEKGDPKAALHMISGRDGGGL